MAGRELQWDRGGFTLIELLLCVVLLMLLAGAAVYNFSSLTRGRELDEAVARFESLVRFAQAHSAQMGRRVRIAFEEQKDPLTQNAGLEGIESSSLRLLWEPDPLKQPGVFEELHLPAWNMDEIAELVTIEAARKISAGPTDSSLPESSGFAGDIAADPVVDDINSVLSEKMPIAPVTFYPDGSSDPAEILLIPRNDSEDRRRATVRISAITGSVTHEFESSVESENEPAGNENDR